MEFTDHKQAYEEHAELWLYAQLTGDAGAALTAARGLLESLRGMYQTTKSLVAA